MRGTINDLSPIVLLYPEIHGLVKISVSFIISAGNRADAFSNIIAPCIILSLKKKPFKAHALAQGQVMLQPSHQMTTIITGHMSWFWLMALNHNASCGGPSMQEPLSESLWLGDLAEPVGLLPRMQVTLPALAWTLGWPKCLASTIVQ